VPSDPGSTAEVFAVGREEFWAGVGEGVGRSRRSVRFLHWGLWLCLLGRGGQVVAGVGGPQTVLNSPSQLSCQGQSLGRWMTRCRAEVARRPGTVISCRRMVAVVALAWNTDAMVRAARVRLNAIAAMTSHAALAAR
jgi:hypothetical protein